MPSTPVDTVDSRDQCPVFVKRERRSAIEMMIRKRPFERTEVDGFR